MRKKTRGLKTNFKCHVLTNNKQTNYLIILINRFKFTLYYILLYGLTLDIFVTLFKAINAFEAAK